MRDREKERGEGSGVYERVRGDREKEKVREEGVVSTRE